MTEELCFLLVDHKFNLEKLKEVSQKISIEEWELIIADTTLLWPMLDTYIWSEKEYMDWVKENGNNYRNMFPHQIRPQEEIRDLLQVLPEKIRTYLYNDLLIIQDEFLPPFTSYELNNYKWYGIDRKELFKLRLESFLLQKTTIEQVRNFSLIQTLYLENPSFYHNVYNAINMDQVEKQLQSNGWMK